MRQSHVLSLIISIFAIDQASKYYVLKHAAFLPKKITPFLNIDLVWNTGVSFGFLNQSSLPFIKYGLMILIGLILLYVLFLLIKTKATLYRFALSLIMGGALGNMADRLYRGAVVDFFYFHINHHHWPVFNVADASICIGVALFMWGQWRGKKV